MARFFQIARFFSDSALFFRWHAFFPDGTLFQMARFFSDGTHFFRWHAFFQMARFFFRWHAFFPDSTLFFRWHAFFQMARFFSDGTLFLHYGTPMACHFFFMARQWHFTLLKARMARHLANSKKKHRTLSFLYAVIPEEDCQQHRKQGICCTA